MIIPCQQSKRLMPAAGKEAIVASSFKRALSLQTSTGTLLPAKSDKARCKSAGPDNGSEFSFNTMSPGRMPAVIADPPTNSLSTVTTVFLKGRFPAMAFRCSSATRLPLRASAKDISPTSISKLGKVVAPANACAIAACKTAVGNPLMQWYSGALSYTNSKKNAAGDQESSLASSQVLLASGGRQNTPPKPSLISSSFNAQSNSQFCP
mmetsp:Transcript_103169/g.162890  ORF Transcript_103169/g.162890 Transcript_103169/m.162890 type:complete len:208 (-) Transcript_103169:872-1495(-)